MKRNSFLPEIIKCTGCDPEDAHLVVQIMRDITHKPLGTLVASDFFEKAKEAYSEILFKRSPTWIDYNTLLNIGLN